MRRGLTSVCSWRCRFPAYALWPLLRGVLLDVGEHVLVAFVYLPPRSGGAWLKRIIVRRTTGDWCQLR
jgi:hypothetical protein